MNELDFGRCIEDILTRMKDGDKDHLSMLPCYYKAPEKQVEECAWCIILDPKNYDLEKF